MNYLNEIYEQTQRTVKKLGWSDDEINSLISQVNERMTKNVQNNVVSAVSNEDLMRHTGKYDGGFILFGGWTNIYDNAIPSGTKGHHLYLAFGGLGVGGWNGNCDINLVPANAKYEGKEVPRYHYGNDDWEGFKTGFKWFHDNVKSFMYMYWPIFEQEVAIFVFFDKDSQRIAYSVPGANLSVGMGGGTVTVKK